MSRERVFSRESCGAPCWGTYHYHSSDAASGYEFAEVVLAAAAQYWDVGGAHVQLQAVPGEPYGGVFPLLNCQRIRDTFGVQQLPWRRAVPELLKQYVWKEPNNESEALNELLRALPIELGEPRWRV